MAKNTTNLELYEKEGTDGNDTFNIQQMLNDNWDKIDNASAPTADPVQAPTGNGPGKIGQWVSWIANRIKAITGKANWFDTPTKSLEQLNTDLDEHKSDTLYQTAGGTATVITLTGVVLENGHSKTFIASANNNGSATTINGKPLYKPNTTTAPTLIAGKAYTVWYNSIGDCFFIKASAEGNVTADKVLAGYTYSSDEDTGKLGAMPNRGTFNLPLGAVVPAGYYSGGSVPNGKRYFASSSYASSSTQFEITGLSFSPNFLIATMESGLDKTNSFVCYFTNGNIIGKIYALFGGTLKEMQIADATKLSDGIRIDTTSDGSIFGTSYKYNWIAIE